MDGINTLIAVAALVIAYRQLDLQTREIKKNSKINSLVHIANMLRDKIDLHEKIIQNMKRKQEDWSGHAARVNNQFRPLMQKINIELIDIIGDQTKALKKSELRQASELDEDGQE